MCLLFLLALVIGSIVLVSSYGSVEPGSGEALNWGLVVLVMTVPLIVAYVSPLFLGPKPWVWIFDLVLICLGLTSCLLMPFTIPLLIFWLKPENKAHFDSP